jgi:hypothetical protein
VLIRYVDSVLGLQHNKTSWDKEFFYTNWKVKQAYKQYIAAIITRTNNLTGTLQHILCWLWDVQSASSILLGRMHEDDLITLPT